MAGENEETTDLEEQPSEQPDPAIEAARVEAETEARKYGWRPKAEFDRDPDGWVDASRFLELPSTQNKALRDARRDLEKQLENERTARAADLARVEAVSKAAIEEVRRQANEKYQSDLAQIAAAKKAAVETADVRQYDQLTQREAQLKPPATEIPQPVAPVARPPEVEEFLAKNDWASDPALFWEGAQAVQAALNSGRDLATPLDQLNYARSVMERKYPHMFAAPAQTQQAPAVSRVDGGGLGGSVRREKGADDLPADVRKIGQEFVSEGVFKDLNAYAKSYFQHNGA